MLEKTKLRDKKAPRFRWSKYRYSVLNKALYNKYKETHNADVSYALFKTIIEDFNTAICDSVVENRDGVKLPAMMGVMALCSFKPRKRVPLFWLRVDEVGGAKVKDFNIETNGLVCKIVYSNYSSKYKFHHSHIWRFKAFRGFKTKASKAFRVNYNYYKKMDNKSVVSKIFKDDYIRTNFRYSRNEQGVVSGLPNNG